MTATDRLENWDDCATILGPRLFRYFLARFSPEDASDLAQETLVRLVRKSGAFDPGRGSIAMFAFGIAGRVAHEERRRQRKPAASFDGDDPPASPEAELGARREIARLRAAIAQLPEAQQKTLSMLLDEEMTLQSAAEALGWPLGTVKSHVHRAKLRLAELLGSGPKHSEFK